MNYSKRLHQLKEMLNELETDAPRLSQDFGALHQSSLDKGIIPNKYKELMALAIGVAVHCDGCIAFHMADAISAGASKQEVLETLSVAVAMGGGPALMYAADAYRAYHQILNDTYDYGRDDTFID